jgi:biopolymer transport protein ExbD
MRYFEVKKPRIEIIPMIDIMLFLLVFFAMLTLRMIPTTGQMSKLPTSSTVSALPPPKLLVEIRGRHELYVEGSKVTPGDITRLVSARDPARLAVTIAGNDSASLQEVMEVIDAVRHGGGTQIGLAARLSEN